MKLKTETVKFALSSQTVDEISEKAQEFLVTLKAEKKNVIRYRLTIEEVLLKWLDKFGEGTEVVFSVGKKFLRPVLSLELKGEPFNPFDTDEQDSNGFGNQILRLMGLSPEYSYTRGCNCLTFKLRKPRKNPIFSLFVAVAAATAVGLLGIWIPVGVKTAVLDGFLTPIYETFFRILGCAAGPMIFLSVAWGIYGIGDAATLGRIGKRMILTYIGTLFVGVSVISAIVIPLFDLNYTAVEGAGSGFSSVFMMLLDIIPSDIVTPFQTGNSLQLIFLAFIVGIAMLFLGKRTAAIAKAVEQINYLVQFLMEFISTLVPYFIFIALVQMIWSDTLTVLAGVAKLLLVFVGAIILLCVANLCWTGFRQRVNPVLLAKKAFPALLIGITTASSAATFGTNMNTCEKKLGIDPSVTSFGLPLGMVMFKPNTAICYLVMGLYFAEAYGIECSLVWLILTVFTVCVLAVATPPIPGGSLTAYAVLFAQLGLPSEALTIALAIDVVLDFLCTGTDVFNLPVQFAYQAGRMGKLDTKILHS